MKLYELKILGFTYTSRDKWTRKVKVMCPLCSQVVYSFRVIGGDPVLGKILLCSQCEGIIKKPGRLHGHAPSRTKVEILLTNGLTEITNSDYPSEAGLGVVGVKHLECGVDMTEYDSVEKGNDVIEKYFECPKCLAERRIKIKLALEHAPVYLA